ncbi:unnamed protein product [Microthlaspi erraticum]|uniref:Uncharacterized protein n=1 Tax=Microthlaspi erraticum TaxID=1685480 RepID=A0A6D2LKN6_9BRAS|nr:unnamed protein product [Microthlaspi erraticum]
MISRGSSHYSRILRVLYKISDEEFKRNLVFYWGEIQYGTLKFNRMDAEVAALRELKKEELIDFFDEFIEIEDIVGFRKSQPLYGSLKGCSQLKL